jgi:hypothetical protein
VVEIIEKADRKFCADGRTKTYGKLPVCVSNVFLFFFLLFYMNVCHLMFLHSFLAATGQSSDML